MDVTREVSIDSQSIDVMMVLKDDNVPKAGQQYVDKEVGTAT